MSQLSVRDSVSVSTSVENWKVLRQAPSLEERYGALIVLTRLPIGWWGRGSIYDLLRAFSFGIGNKMSLGYGIPLDSVAPEDAAHDVWVLLPAITPKIRSDDPKAWKSWLFVLVRNQLYVNLRQSWGLVTASDYYELKGTIEQHEESGVDSKLQVCIEVAIASLPEKLRQVATCRILHGMSTSDSSIELNMKPATVRKNLQRARERLAPLLNDLITAQTGGISAANV